MDQLSTEAQNEQLERDVEATMIEQGVSYGEALYIVAMKQGELHGCLLSTRPLTEEQRRLRQRTLLDVMRDNGELDDREFEALTAPIAGASRDTET